MSIRRKSTTHDLATLRLHPDGSRVQQSSANSRRRRARYTVVDSRGNWIARDAGGSISVKKRRSIQTDDAGGELIDLSGDEENENGPRRPSKGKQRARDSQSPQEDQQASERLDARSKQRLSFIRDLSFLDPAPSAVSSLEQDTDHSGATPTIFPDPASDMLKSIHHFASCYYREQGQLFDSGKYYREKRKEKYTRSQENIHTLTSDMKHENIDSEWEDVDTGDVTTEEDEIESENEGESEGESESEGEGEGEGEGEDAGGSQAKALEARPETYRKDMYKAFDGSALMAIGIVLQEYVAHTLLAGTHDFEQSRGLKRRRTG